MRYPDYVKEYRPKGTIIKKVNNTYYAYYATSKRTKDKSYPVQVITGLAGIIDQYGFHKTNRNVVDVTSVIIRESGFTNYLLKFEDEYILKRHESIKQKKSIYRSLIVYLSNNSYLIDDKSIKIYSIQELVDKFHIGIPNQITSLEKMIGHKLNKLDQLKYICSVSMGNRMYESKLSDNQKQLLNELGLSEDDIRRFR